MSNQEDETTSSQSANGQESQETEEESNQEGSKKPKLDLDKIQDLFTLVASKKDQNINDLRPHIYKHLLKIIDRHELDEYLLLYLYEPNDQISEGMVDRIYNAIPDDNEKPILFLLHNHGGRIEPAYLISKTCKELTNKFVIVVPRKAKSAATLIALGGHEIHMGPTSELGPIDPQFGGLPALGISSSLESIAKIVSDYPKSSSMFSEFMKEKLDLRILGYFERVSESAKQYANRLLSNKDLPNGSEKAAHKFVYEYKDHSFVIDKEEANKLLGDMIQDRTPEYNLGNEIHTFLNKVNFILDLLTDKSLSIVGDIKNIQFSDVKKKED